MVVGVGVAVGADVAGGITVLSVMAPLVSAFSVIQVYSDGPDHPSMPKNCTVKWNWGVGGSGD